MQEGRRWLFNEVVQLTKLPTCSSSNSLQPLSSIWIPCCAKKIPSADWVSWIHSQHKGR